LIVVKYFYILKLHKFKEPHEPETEPGLGTWGRLCYWCGGSGLWLYCEFFFFSVFDVYCWV